jgi:L-ascorbate metabolism protein UlaG (beta-lactamase superfamily)
MIELAYLGHATSLVTLGGATVITDPVLRSRIGPLRRHGARPPATLRPDVVVISHQHRDHLDLASLRLLDPSIPVIAPRGTGAIVARGGAEHVVEVSRGDRIEVAGIAVKATEAIHDGRRDPWGDALDPVGYLFERGGQRVYFPGDTDIFDGMSELGALDLALVPVWGWGPTLGAGHLDPATAARTLKLLQPAVAVPIHWGTFYPPGLSLVKPGPLREPPLLFERLARSEAPQVDVRVLKPGDRTRIEAAVPTAVGS